MTNRELVEAAWAELAETTISGQTYHDRLDNGYRGKPYNFTATAWHRAMLLLDQIKDLPVAPPPPPTPDVPGEPILWNPVVFQPRSGQANYFDAGGRDARILTATVEQGAPNPVASNQNAIVTLANPRNFVVEPLHIHAANRMKAGNSVAYGHGLYIQGDAARLGWVDGFVGDGDGLGQAVVVAAPSLRLQLVRSRLEPMHPVWNTSGRPLDVHTDAFQSWAGCALELHDTLLRTCGSAIQTQPYKYSNVKQIGGWKFNRVLVEQVYHPDSDEDPFCLTKDIASGNGGRFPTDFRGCKVRSRGTRFGVSWQSDPAAWNPGSWGNTGEPWVILG